MVTALTSPASAEAASGEAQAPAFRTLPHNIEAEKALLGAIFVNNRAYERVSDFLTLAHFALNQHGRIFEACGRLIERGQIADPVTLKALFEQDQGLADVGGTRLSRRAGWRRGHRHQRRRIRPHHLRLVSQAAAHRAGRGRGQRRLRERGRRDRHGPDRGGRTAPLRPRRHRRVRARLQTVQGLALERHRDGGRRAQARRRPERHADGSPGHRQAAGRAPSL